MMKRIKYISFFDFQDAVVKRSFVTSATNKMESICDILNSIGYSVDIISMSPVEEPRFRFYKGSRTERRQGLKLKLFSSWGGRNKVLRSVRLLWHLVAMFVYLLTHTKKNDIVLVYHSQGYFDAIRWAKKLRRFKMVLEVEEVYDDVGKPKFKLMSAAEKRMIKDADAYIFPTEMLDDKINQDHRPSAIIYGGYRTEPQITEKYDDGKIHVVYAGTFDPRKGGASAAASAAVYLPSNYHIHICGFGNDADTENIKKQILEIQKTAKATISFDGLKKGKDYIEFIQKCHVGLSTQDPSAAFNATSFPSKILSYMSNGLAVVSVDIPAISNAKIAPYINFYQDQTPENIAKAIISANLNNDNRRVVDKLAKQFRLDINNLIFKLKTNSSKLY